MKAELQDALEAVQRVLRETGLPHLAAQVPVKAADDLQAVRSGIRIINGLLRLRPPSETAQKALMAPWTTLTKIIDGS